MLFKIRLIMFDLASRALGINPTYNIRFIDGTSKRVELRGRLVDEGKLHYILALWSQLKSAADARKESNHGIYYISAEARIENLHHEGSTASADPAQAGGELFAGLPAAPENGPAPADSPAPQAADEQAARGAGAVDTGDDRPQAPAVKVSLGDLGVR